MYFVIKAQLKDANNRSTTTIKKLSNELKDFKERLTNTNSELCNMDGKTKLYYSTMTEIYEKLSPIVGPRSVLKDEVIDEIEMEDVMEGRSGENKLADMKKETISKAEVNTTVLPELKEDTKATPLSDLKEENKASNLSDLKAVNKPLTSSDLKEGNKTPVKSELKDVNIEESVTVEVPNICEGVSKPLNKTCGNVSNQDANPGLLAQSCEKETEKPKSQTEVLEIKMVEDIKEDANPSAVETQQVGSPRATRSPRVKAEEKKTGKK